MSQEGRHVQEPWQRKALLQVQVTIAYMEQLVAYMANFAVRAAPRRGPDGRFISPGTPAHASFLLLVGHTGPDSHNPHPNGLSFTGAFRSMSNFF